MWRVAGAISNVMQCWSGSCCQQGCGWACLVSSWSCREVWDVRPQVFSFLFAFNKSLVLVPNRFWGRLLSRIQEECIPSSSPALISRFSCHRLETWLFISVCFPIIWIRLFSDAFSVGNPAYMSGLTSPKSLLRVHDECKPFLFFTYLTDTPR